MQTTLYLIRHGKTNNNTTPERFQGQDPTPKLNAKGKKECTTLRKKLEKVKIEKVFTSPLKRAKDTAKIAFPKKNVCVEKELTERSYGDAEGITREELAKRIEKKHPAAAKELRESKARTTKIMKAINHVLSFEKIGGESLPSIKKRSYGTVMKLLSKNRGKAVAIVTHCEYIKAFLSATYKKDYSVFPVPTGSIIKVKFEEKNGKLKAKPLRVM